MLCKVLEKEDFLLVIDILLFYVVKEDKLGEMCERKFGFVKMILFCKKVMWKKIRKFYIIEWYWVS